MQQAKLEAGKPNPNLLKNLFVGAAKLAIPLIALKFISLAKTPSHGEERITGNKLEIFDERVNAWVTPGEHHGLNIRDTINVYKRKMGQRVPDEEKGSDGSTIFLGTPIATTEEEAESTTEIIELSSFKIVLSSCVGLESFVCA